MERLYKMARGYNARFPNGAEPYQMLARLLEECGEVASEVSLWEDSGIKRQKHGEPTKEALAGEIKQAMAALAQLAAHYHVEAELEASIQASLDRMEEEGLFQ